MRINRFGYDWFTFLEKLHARSKRLASRLVAVDASLLNEQLLVVDQLADEALVTWNVRSLRVREHRPALVPLSQAFVPAI